MFYNREIVSVTPSLFWLIIVAEVTSAVLDLFNLNDVMDVKEFQ